MVSFDVYDCQNSKYVHQEYIKVLFFFGLLFENGKRKILVIIVHPLMVDFILEEQLKQAFVSFFPKINLVLKFRLNCTLEMFVHVKLDHK